MKLNLQITKVTIACFTLLSTVNLTVKAQEVITLQKAIDLALDRNLTIKQAKLTEALSTEDYRQAKNNLLPNLFVNSQGSYNFGRATDQTNLAINNGSFFYNTNSASAQVTVFQGGQLRNQIIQNRLLLDADKSNTAKIKNDLILSVVTQYLTILTNQDLVTAAKQQIDISKIALDRAQKSYDAGNQTLADLSQAKAQQSTAELNLTTAQNQLDLSLLILKQYMEMDPLTPIEVEKPDISKLSVATAYDPQNVLNTALAINPDVVLAQTREKAYLQAIKIAKGGYYPTLSLSGSVVTQYSSTSKALLGTVQGFNTVNGNINGVPTTIDLPTTTPVFGGTTSFATQLSNNLNQSVGFNLQIPIFNRFFTRTAVRKAKINYENAQVSTQLAKNNLSKTIIQAVLDVQAAEKKRLSMLQTYNANKEAFNVIQERYNVGLVNSLDYNTSLTNLNKSQFDLIQAQYEVVFRSKVIDYYLGNPITL
ncbi:TolC family protein [Mucilaginibacter sp. AK015]|uniref:TolC family protein n=1 Tax=Mucilaginibacter sp. AK015 TaxID=2723072 RepID=UPI001619B4C8|nr:TolC family protein [Mucilaginibacter sp. AK015]MBB5396637.1 outer membrane protein [Mucilaginibacter sp. AK015]